MQHARSHIGQLAELAVGDGLDRLGITDNLRVGNQNSGDVRPVLIAGCAHGPRHDRACNVGASPRKCMDCSVRSGTVKARNHRPLDLSQPLCKHLIRLLLVKHSVFIKEDHLRGIDKLIIEIVRHHDAVEIFPTGRRVPGARLLLKVPADLLKFFFQ